MVNSRRATYEIIELSEKSGILIIQNTKEEVGVEYDPPNAVSETFILRKKTRLVGGKWHSPNLRKQHSCL